MKTENTIRVSKSVNEILGGKLTHIITLKKTTHQNSYNNRTEKKLSGKDKLYLFFSSFFLFTSFHHSRPFYCNQVRIMPVLLIFSGKPENKHTVLSSGSIQLEMHLNISSSQKSFLYFPLDYGQIRRSRRRSSPLNVFIHMGLGTLGENTESGESWK